MFDIAALGEILIDFTMQGFNTQRQRIFAQNPGGAPANVAAAVAKLGEILIDFTMQGFNTQRQRIFAQDRKSVV